MEREQPPLLDTVGITVSLVCTIKQDEQRWAAGCPALDLFSQGETEDEAKRCLTEAVELWLESCLERGTLDEALREVGFRKVRPEEIRPDDQQIRVGSVEDVAKPAGTFPVHVTIPAYQAAAFLSAPR
jgi:predicted RNase H-like HicB family nuclease